MTNSYQIKEKPEDFIVDEILNNGSLASNPKPVNKEEGKIHWVCLKKRMWNTIDLTKEIAKRLRTNEKYINYAGIKDRVAVTYQCFSINSERENLIERINNIKDVEVTSSWKDRKWITSQDILGNKFEIKVKGKIKKKNIKEILNYFGEQRFGNVRGNNHLIGLNLIKGKFKEAVDLYFRNGDEFVFEKEKENVYFLEKTNIYNLKTRKKIKGGKIILGEFSVTATENVLMAAALTPQETTIEIAACEPHVQELAEFLRKMGVEIKGEGTHTIIIRGKNNLKGANHFISPDYVEAGTYVLMAMAVSGEITVKNVPVKHLKLFLKQLKNFGGEFKILPNESIRVGKKQNLKMRKIQALPYPGIPTDLQSAFGVLATQTEGLTLIHDPLYDGRLKYLEELNKMGADIIICDPHRAVVNGPTELYGTELGPLDLRGGAALIIAGLIAKGTTVIKNASQVDRGYEKIEERLQKIGADIRRVKE